MKRYLQISLLDEDGFTEMHTIKSETECGEGSPPSTEDISRIFKTFVTHLYGDDAYTNIDIYNREEINKMVNKFISI